MLRRLNVDQAKQFSWLIQALRGKQFRVKLDLPGFIVVRSCLHLQTGELGELPDRVMCSGLWSRQIDGG